MYKNVCKLLAAILFVTACSEKNDNPQTSGEPNLTIISAETGKESLFIVENAVTPEELQTGLMFRDSLEPAHGMAFDLRGYGNAVMWMKDTKIPLDMVFANNGKVIWVYENAEPMSTKNISSPEHADVVFELNAGDVKLYNIKPGDTVKHVFFGNTSEDAPKPADESSESSEPEAKQTAESIVVVE